MKGEFNFIIKHYKRINISIVSILHLPLIIQGFESSENGSWCLREQRRPIFMGLRCSLRRYGTNIFAEFLGKNLDIVVVSNVTICPSHRLNRVKMALNV